MMQHAGKTGQCLLRGRVYPPTTILCRVIDEFNLVIYFMISCNNLKAGRWGLPTTGVAV